MLVNYYFPHAVNIIIERTSCYNPPDTSEALPTNHYHGNSTLRSSCCRGVSLLFTILTTTLSPPACYLVCRTAEPANRPSPPRQHGRQASRPTRPSTCPPPPVRANRHSSFDSPSQAKARTYLLPYCLPFLHFLLCRTRR